MSFQASKGLGKGLSALMAEEYSHETLEPSKGEHPITTLPINALTAGEFQPRSYFDDTALTELADSIKRNGVMQPLLIRALATPRNNADYEIIAGERRWRASKLAGLKEVPVLVRDIDDKKALELALIENIQRQDLNAIEESEGYQQLIDRFDYTQEELSTIVGKSRSHVANSLRLLQSPKEIKAALADKVISAGHARALLKSDDPAAMLKIVTDQELNVRQTEALVRGDLDLHRTASAPSGSNTSSARQAPKRQQRHSMDPDQALLLIPDDEKDPDLLALQEALTEQVGVSVKINNVDDSGHVVLAYGSLEELDLILNRIGSV